MTLKSVTQKAIFGLAMVTGFTLADLPAYAVEAGTWQARYRVYVSSLPLGQIDINGSIDNTDYKVTGDARLTGLVGAAFKISGGAEVKGEFQSPTTTKANDGYKFH